MVFSKSDRTKYHHFPMLFFPMNINYKKWWHKAVVFTGNGGKKRWFYSKVVEQSATTLYFAAMTVGSVKGAQTLTSKAFGL